MGRPKNHAGDAYTIIVPVKMNSQAIEILDKLRGTTPRSTYLRNLLREEARKNPNKLRP